MSVTINATSAISDTMQNIHITVVVDGKDIKFNHSAPIDLEGQALQDYVDGKESFYICEIRRNQYPDAPRNIYNSGDPDEWNGWIKDGCVIPTKTDSEGNTIKPETVAEKRPWIITHPK